MSKGKVLVAMSGGIDSSVAAIMLHEQGYEVIGITMKTWEHDPAALSKETGCCNIDAFNDARELSVRMGFPYYILDLKAEFEEHIVSNFIGEYLQGRTPNPCVLCNTHIKWNALLKRADALGCQYIATGHYSKIRKVDERYILSRGLDPKKDQSYVLWGLKQEVLARTLFPLGGYTKEEIRDFATKAGFHNLAQKKESYEICFVPNDDYRAFLRSRVTDIDTKVGPGKFVLSDGTVVGKHKGFPFYTIGQRKGLEVAVGHPLYVLSIDASTNTIVLGTREELDCTSMNVEGINLIKYSEIEKDLNVKTQIRYNHSGVSSIIEMKDGLILNSFLEPVSAVTPGQSAVFYEGDDVVGGGIIL